jgi:uncharacterized membrane protein
MMREMSDVRYHNVMRDVAKTGAVIAALALLILLSSCAKKPAYPEAPVSADEVRIDIAALGEGSPKFYSFEHEGKRVDFFVIKAGGQVESYLDACRKCSPKRKGYRFIDGEMVCIACGKSYPADDLRGVGSCYPIPLAGSSREGYYAVDVRELVRAKRYF